MKEVHASVLKQVIILWMMIRIHALAKPNVKWTVQVYDNEKDASKKKALRNELSKAQYLNSIILTHIKLYMYIFTMMYIDLIYHSTSFIWIIF